MSKSSELLYSRRSFVKTAGVVAATLAIGGGVVGCSSNSSNSDTKSTSTDNSSNGSTSTDKTSTTVEAVDQKRVYVTPEWVNSAINGEQKGYEDLYVAEVVYAEAALAKSYDEGHIPGATYVFDVDVEDADGTEERPYNILPVDELEANILTRGITKDTKVVLYGADISGTARVAYGLLYAGVEDVKILNGGIEAWTAAGFETEKTANVPDAASSFGTTVPAHPEYYTTMDDAIEKLASDSNFKLVSIRSEAEWLGETSGYSYIDRAGEPEGAVWGKGAQSASDVADFTNNDGTVKELSEIEKEVWSDCDFTLDNHLAFYCGTGWRATVPFLLMYQEGYTDISLYDGGWYEWQMYDENKVQVGDPASSSCEHTTVAELPTDKAAAN